MKSDPDLGSLYMSIYTPLARANHPVKVQLLSTTLKALTEEAAPNPARDPQWSYIPQYPEGPSTQYLRTLVPRTSKGTVF